MGLLSGKVALVTGGGAGIGRADAILFAREGARVVVNDLGAGLDGSGGDASAASTVVGEIEAFGGQALADVGDVADEADADAMVASAINAFGRLDIVVNNAGILRDKTLHKMEAPMWDEVIRVHLRGTFLCSRAAARHFRESGDGGRIINTTSVSGLMGNFGQSNYAAAKAGIAGFTRTASIELKKYRVTVNAIAPVALTRMTEGLPMMAAMKQADTLLSADLIAPAALFLASELAADITGEIVGVEGNRIFLYKMHQTEAVTPTAQTWTPDELRARWSEIAGD